MKKYLLALCMVFSISAMAQEGRNERITIGMNSLNYTVKEQKSTLSKVLDVLLTGEVTTNQDVL